MAKSKQKAVKVTFVSDTGEVLLETSNVVFKAIPAVEGVAKFMHLENKGTQWLLLHSADIVFSDTVTLGRIHLKRRPVTAFTVPDGRELEVSKYTIINTESPYRFYHFDELTDGTYRICHSKGLFESEAHYNLDYIEFAYL